jgi:hypothetical protein
MAKNKNAGARNAAAYKCKLTNNRRFIKSTLSLFFSKVDE